MLISPCLVTMTDGYIAIVRSSKNVFQLDVMLEEFCGICIIDLLEKHETPSMCHSSTAPSARKYRFVVMQSTTCAHPFS